MTDPAMRQCPHCDETIRATAKKCRFCHEWIDGSAPPVTGPARGGVVATVVAGASAVSAVLGVLTTFTSDSFGIGDLLTEVGVFGFAIYVGLIPTVGIIVLLVNWWPELEEHPTALGATALVIALLVAAAIRFGLFADGLTSDLDEFGRFFTVLVGVGVVLSGLWAVGRLRGRDRDSA